MHSLMYVHRVSWSFNFKAIITFKPHSLPMKCYTTHQNIRAVGGVTGQAACLVQTDICGPDYRKGCRYFATSSDPIITNVPAKIPWYKKVFLREFASRTYDESKFIDFDEESHGDYYVPLSLFMAENSKKDQEIGILKSQLDLTLNLMADMLVLIDLRYSEETMMSKYWIQTPQSTTYRQDTLSLINAHYGIVSSTMTSNLSLLPPQKKKILAQFDESFIKWVYILEKSCDPFLVSFRKSAATSDLIEAAAKLVFVVTIVHNATHKIIPNNLRIKRPSQEEMKRILKDNYKVPETDVCTTFQLLQMKDDK